MDFILYFADTVKECKNFLRDLSARRYSEHIFGKLDYRNMKMETGKYTVYAVSTNSSKLIGAPGFRYYINHALEEEFNQMARFKLLNGAKELKSTDELIELLKH